MNEGVDTRLRTLEEVVARMIRPVPANLIDQKPDKSKADYINITTVKDLLDVACGRGNWSAEVTQMLAVPPNHLGLIVRLSVETADRGIRHQDGTGHEVTDDPKIYGDPLTNAYAQALRRAAESFGMARELWRRETISAQETAKQLVKSGAFGAPAAKPGYVEPGGDESEAAHDDMDKKIRARLAALKKSEADLTEWVNKKFETVGEWHSQSLDTKVAVLDFLNKKAAA